MHIIACGFAQAHLYSVDLILAKGEAISTDYDKPDEPKSLDLPLMIEVMEPWNPPVFSKCVWDSAEGLFAYKDKVLFGDDSKVSYTYHDRLWREDQIFWMEEELKRNFHSRRAQAITWIPKKDQGSKYPPCFVAGTLVSTPTGEVPVEGIGVGDEVYAVDGGLYLEPTRVVNTFTRVEPCVEVGFSLGSITVSCGQLLLTKRGWVRADLLTTSDKVFVPTGCARANTEMVVGFMHGDGWLSSTRRDVCFSVHPDADVAWLYQWIKENSSSTPQESCRYTESDVASGVSRKLVLSDKSLWFDLRDHGCPVGPKLNLEITLDYQNWSDSQIWGFLTGIFSAEGSIVTSSSHSLSIQLGMMWGQCVDLVCDMLDVFGIGYTRYIYESKFGVAYSVRIDRQREIFKLMDAPLFGFGLDSRKQSRWLQAKANRGKSEKYLQERKDKVALARWLHDKCAIPAYKLRKVIPGCHPRWFSNREYTPSYRHRQLPSVNLESSGLWMPIEVVRDVGENRVYDFSVGHPSHAIVANGIAAHNCLQRVWARVRDDKLDFHTHWRSRDMLKAWGSNVFAFAHLHKIFAENLGVPIGIYREFIDSAHIYGRDIEAARNMVKRPLEDWEWPLAEIR